MRRVSRMFGENLFENEWDVAIIIDAASYEILEELAEEYEYITSVDARWSRGSKSNEWAQNTFIEDDVQLDDVNYVNGNALSALVASGVHEKEFFHGGGPQAWMVEHYLKNELQQFNSHHPVWLKGRDGLVSDDEEFYIPSESVTATALDVLDEYDGRTLVHYMQPHEPFIGASDRYSMWPYANGYSSLNMTDEDYNSVIDAFTENHRLILCELRKLLAEIDDELDVVVTADHGNMYGRIAGVPYAFGHPEYIWFERNVRKVPYAHVDQSVVDETVDVEPPEDDEATPEEVVERLESLGYK